MSPFSPFPTWLRLINAKFYESSQDSILLRRAVKNEIGDLPGSLLEIGCGFGFNAAFRDGDYLGIDPDSRVIEIARKRRPVKNFDIRDGASIDLPDAGVDNVLLCLVIHELEPQKREKVLREAARVAKDRIFIFEHRQNLRGLTGWWVRFNERRHYDEYLHFDLPAVMKSLGLAHEKHEDLGKIFQLDVFGN